MKPRQFVKIVLVFISVALMYSVTIVQSLAASSGALGVDLTMPAFAHRFNELAKRSHYVLPNVAQTGGSYPTPITLSLPGSVQISVTVGFYSSPCGGELLKPNVISDVMLTTEHYDNNFDKIAELLVSALDPKVSSDLAKATIANLESTYPKQRPYGCEPFTDTFTPNLYIHYWRYARDGQRPRLRFEAAQ